MKILIGLLSYFPSEPLLFLPSECVLYLNAIFNFRFIIEISLRISFAYEYQTVFNVFIQSFNHSMNLCSHYVGEFLVLSTNRAVLILINQLHLDAVTNRCSAKKVFSQHTKIVRNPWKQQNPWYPWFSMVLLFLILLLMILLLLSMIFNDFQFYFHR